MKSIETHPLPLLRSTNFRKILWVFYGTYKRGGGTLCWGGVELRPRTYKTFFL